MSRLGFETPVNHVTWMDRALLRYATRPQFARAMGMNKDVYFRPARLLFVGRLLFPPRRELFSFYRGAPGWAFPFLSIAHPFVILLRLLR